MKEIRTVTVIGANGAMGCNVAGIFASFGESNVFMVCRELVAAVKAVEKAKLTVKAETIEQRLIPKTYEDLEECIQVSDLVFESVVENFEIKREVYKKINKFLKEDTIIGTGTSGLSVNELSDNIDGKFKKNFMGIHMFNPPYSLTLCELIATDNTDRHLLLQMKEYLHKKLYRTVVDVKDFPAFLANRIGFEFINMEMQLAEKYQNRGGIDYIDAIICGYTGRNMQPLVTADFVGLDVHKSIVDNVEENIKDYASKFFVLPKFAQKLIIEKKLGRKTGCGLYSSEVESSGKKIKTVYDIKTSSYRPIKDYDFDFINRAREKIKTGDYLNAYNEILSNQSDEAKICVNSIVSYVLYGIYSARLICNDVMFVDDVMATGFNWMPPLAFIDLFGGMQNFTKVAIRCSNEIGVTEDMVKNILKDVPNSKYDFRPFIKARA